MKMTVSEKFIAFNSYINKKEIPINRIPIKIEGLFKVIRGYATWWVVFYQVRSNSNHERVLDMKISSNLVGGKLNFIAINFFELLVPPIISYSLYKFSILDHLKIWNENDKTFPYYIVDNLELLSLSAYLK